MISIGLAPVLPLTGKDLIAFRGMLENADSILLNGLDDGTIRVAFTTEHVWRE